MQITDVTDMPLAMAGLKSYRYRGRYGWIMIGAADDQDALREANRSLSSGQASVDNLQMHNGTEYVPVAQS